MLHDPRAHEPLSDRPWVPSQAEAAIRAIARDADAALRPRGRFWPLHPLDDDGATPDVVHGVYLGAAGVLWALDRLAAAGLHEPAHDYGALAHEALDGYRRAPEFAGPLPSLLVGESGIALVAWLLAPDDAVADRLHALVAEPLGDRESLELLWGGPGLLLVARTMGERTGDPRWAVAAAAIAERVVAARDVDGLWTQRLPGMAPVRLLGAAHGAAGVLAALGGGRGAREAAAMSALAGHAVREGDHANWPPAAGDPLRHPRQGIRTQWCHGAPGVVLSVAGLDGDLLDAGAQLAYDAGPLRKGAGLCHGTAGNGFALLRRFTATGDEEWLHRARRFAMHAVTQVEAAYRTHGRGRHSLWTGDPGVALVLQACLDGTSGLPTIDVW